MKHLFLAIHHPKPEHLDDLLGAMAGLGETLARVPGLVEVRTWRDESRVVAMSVWESREALAAARPTMGAAIVDVPFAQWEARPRELYFLDEFSVPAVGSEAG
ncbi:MAG: antibiotic biosynthesis monooxygenase [Chloroflexi bacterium]|nr:antibiotic biosynthesis monooxygenase [Chloroflexota bacterium]MBF6606840.1 antibiotic biosynthesis monooxygenase [Chloroflexota bacterium]